MTKITPVDSVPQYSDPPGPTSKRSCRDFFFLLLFGAYWAGMVVVALISISNGDIRVLLYPKDSSGNLCGIDNSVTNSSKLNALLKPNLYVFNPLQTNSTQICVATCPNATLVPTYAQNNYFCKLGISATGQGDLILKQQDGSCTSLIYESKAILNRCIPTGNLTEVMGNSTNASLVVWGQNMVQTLIQDISTTWAWMLGALGACLVLCFIWLFFLRYLGGLITFLTLILMEGVFGGLAYYMYTVWQAKLSAWNSAVSTGTTTSTLQYERDMALAFFIIFIVLGVLFLFMIIALRNRIRIAVQIIKEASKAVMSIPLIVFFPLVSFVSIIILVAYYLVIAAYMATGPDTTSLSIISVPQTINFFKYFQWYHLFGFLWTLAFIIGVNQTTLAGAIASWYWTMDKKHLPSFPLLRSFYRTIRYHLGSVAFGSLLIALTQLIRIFLLYTQKQLRGTNNRVAMCVLSCLQCCFACIEKIVKFINKNAYVYMAIYGTSFCTSARRAVELLVRNAFRLVALNFVSTFIIFISKFVVALGTAGGLYVLLNYTNSTGTTQTQFIAAVCCVVFVASWVIAACFFGVYQMSMDTIFLCFCEDCERNDGSENQPYFMSDGLAAITNVTKTPMQEKGKKKKKHKKSKDGEKKDTMKTGSIKGKEENE
ncbi:hypothetical protein HMI54_003106 [Coelomomyces lativittatus]|nr:hypothetical protein HMI56_006232 [Coelomomyces lativittatus]KAJ1516928.1 hypothetical protein HMI55_001033 [Coelomomyces lativittatus]KAJ1518002.1 hypothetical protein HMI54_003106 [Coelomomyces lativittatus]